MGRGAFADGGRSNLEYRLTDQDQIILHEVHEPATWGLLAAGVLGLVAARWRSTRPARQRQPQ